MLGSQNFSKLSYSPSTFSYENVIPNPLAAGEETGVGPLHPAAPDSSFRSE